MAKLIAQYTYEELRNRFQHLDSLPVLVVGIYHKHPHVINHRFKDQNVWMDIAHQTAGHLCNQHYLTGRILNPTDKMSKFMEELTYNWLDSDCGMFGVSLEEILSYRKQLEQSNLGLDCNLSYSRFEEGIYPIDCSSDLLKKITTDEIPDNLDEWIDFESDRDRLLGCVNRWSLFVLGENCD